MVSTGNGCQLPLVFAPTTAVSGTLTLSYNYVDGSGAARSRRPQYPVRHGFQRLDRHRRFPERRSHCGHGRRHAVRGGHLQHRGRQNCDGFGCHHGSDQASLRVGVQKPPPFTCDSVSAGNGCQLQLQYAPAALTSGTLNLSYGYTDASGNPNFGVLNIPYAATSNNNAVGSVAPTGQITAMLGASAQPIAVTFTSDDGRLATSLQITAGLASLPAGWSVAATAFNCATFTSGTGCRLGLTYAPAAVDNGTLTLSYSYLNNAGETKTGSVAIPYQTTTNDNVIATASPLSVTAASGSTTPVTVTFTTDDGNFAGTLAADLSALPAGWTAPASSFTCATLSVGTACQASLSYAPTAAASGTLAFGYSYINSAGTAKTGTVSIPYTATP